MVLSLGLYTRWLVGWLVLLQLFQVLPLLLLSGPSCKKSFSVYVRQDECIGLQFALLWWTYVCPHLKTFRDIQFRDHYEICGKGIILACQFFFLRGLRWLGAADPAHCMYPEERSRSGGSLDNLKSGCWSTFSADAFYFGIKRSDKGYGFFLCKCEQLGAVGRTAIFFLSELWSFFNFCSSMMVAVEHESVSILHIFPLTRTSTVEQLHGWGLCTLTWKVKFESDDSSCSSSWTQFAVDCVNPLVPSSLQVSSLASRRSFFPLIICRILLQITSSGSVNPHLATWSHNRTRYWATDSPYFIFDTFFSNLQRAQSGLTMEMVVESSNDFRVFV